MKALNSSSIASFHRSLSGPLMAVSYVGLSFSSPGSVQDIKPYLLGGAVVLVDRQMMGSGSDCSSSSITLLFDAVSS